MDLQLSYDLLESTQSSDGYVMGWLRHARELLHHYGPLSPVTEQSGKGGISEIDG